MRFLFISLVKRCHKSSFAAITTQHPKMKKCKRNLQCWCYVMHAFTPWRPSAPNIVVGGIHVHSYNILYYTILYHTIVVFTAVDHFRPLGALNVHQHTSTQVLDVNREKQPSPSELERCTTAGHENWFYILKFTKLWLEVAGSGLDLPKSVICRTASWAT